FELFERCDDESGAVWAWLAAVATMRELVSLLTGDRSRCAGTVRWCDDSVGRGHRHGRGHGHGHGHEHGHGHGHDRYPCREAGMAHRPTPLGVGNAEAVTVEEAFDGEGALVRARIGDHAREDFELGVFHGATTARPRVPSLERVQASVPPS